MNVRKELARLVIDGQLTEREAARLIVEMETAHDRDRNRDIGGRPVCRERRVLRATTQHPGRGHESRYRATLARLPADAPVQPVQPLPDVQVPLMPQRRTPRPLRATLPRGKPDMRDYRALKYRGPTPSNDYDWDAALLRFARIVNELGYPLSPEQQKRLDDDS